MMTPKLAREMGPALSLGAIQKPSLEPAKKLCRRHLWTRKKWSRKCSVCGREDELDQATGEWVSPTGEREYDRGH